MKQEQQQYALSLVHQNPILFRILDELVLLLSAHRLAGQAFVPSDDIRSSEGDPNNLENECGQLQERDSVSFVKRANREISR